MTLSIEYFSERGPQLLRLAVVPRAAERSAYPRSTLLQRTQEAGVIGASANDTLNRPQETVRLPTIAPNYFVRDVANPKSST